MITELNINIQHVIKIANLQTGTDVETPSIPKEYSFPKTTTDVCQMPSIFFPLIIIKNVY